MDLLSRSVGEGEVEKTVDEVCTLCVFLKFTPADKAYRESRRHACMKIKIIIHPLPSPTVWEGSARAH